jgi:hypothetical protein
VRFTGVRRMFPVGDGSAVRVTAMLIRPFGTTSIDLKALCSDCPPA